MNTNKDASSISISADEDLLKEETNRREKFAAYVRLQGKPLRICAFVVL